MLPRSRGSKLKADPSTKLRPCPFERRSWSFVSRLGCYHLKAYIWSKIQSNLDCRWLFGRVFDNIDLHYYVLIKYVVIRVCFIRKNILIVETQRTFFFLTILVLYLFSPLTSFWRGGGWRVEISSKMSNANTDVLHITSSFII